MACAHFACFVIGCAFVNVPTRAIKEQIVPAVAVVVVMKKVACVITKILVDKDASVVCNPIDSFTTVVKVAGTASGALQLFPSESIIVKETANDFTVVYNPFDDAVCIYSLGRGGLRIQRIPSIPRIPKHRLPECSEYFKDYDNPEDLSILRISKIGRL